MRARSSWCCGLAVSHGSMLHVGLTSIRFSALDRIVQENGFVMSCNVNFVNFWQLPTVKCISLDSESYVSNFPVHMDCNVVVGGWCFHVGQVSNGCFKLLFLAFHLWASYWGTGRRENSRTKRKAKELIFFQPASWIVVLHWMPVDFFQQRQ